MSMLRQCHRLIVSATVGAFALTAALPAAAQSDKPFEGVTLRVATFGGAWKESIVNIIGPKFEALGGTIEYVTGSPQTNLAKVIAARGRAPFDVMEVLDAQEKEIFSDPTLIQKIDLDKIPNKQYLDEWQYNDWRIASWHTQEGICYNRDKFAELGIDPPTTYADLANPKLAGRIIIPDIASGGGLANFAAIAHAAGGDETNVQPGLDLINSLQALRFWSQGGDVVTQFGTGDVYAAVIHSGWCVRARNAGVNVMTVHPKIDDEHTGVHKYGWLVIMKSSEVADAANWFLNAYQEVDYQLDYAKVSGVVPVNREALAKLKDDPVLSEMLQLDPADIARQLRIDYSKADISAWIDQWNRSVTQ